MTNPGSDGPAPLSVLDLVAADIESFADLAGWDRPASLYALVPTRTLAADPAAASMISPDGSALDPDAISPAALTPIAQEELPDQPLDEVLAGIGWPDEVVGCALSHEIVMLPPGAESDLGDLDADQAIERAAAHPDRREARLVVAVLRDGTAASLLRLRGTGPTADGSGSAESAADGSRSAGSDELLSGTDLAPNLVEALLATLR